MFCPRYIYQPIEHVPEAQVAGFETAFTHVQRKFHSLASCHRYIAIMLISTESRTKIDQPIYRTVTEFDRQSSIRLYGGADFSRADFRYLNTTPGIAKVLSNGQFDLSRPSEQ